MSPNGIIPAEEAGTKEYEKIILGRKKQRLTNVVIWDKRRDYWYAIRNRAKVDHINLIQKLRQRTVNNASLRT